MIHSQTCTHAMRALIYLASANGDGPVGVRTIAREAEVTPQMAAKLLLRLRRDGFLTSQKGPGGGYQLAKPSSEIRLCDVIEAIDGPVNMREGCVLGLDRCSDEASCALHDFWKVFREQYWATVSTMTLRDAATTMERKRLSVGESG